MLNIVPQYYKATKAFDSYFAHFSVLHVNENVFSNFCYAHHFLNYTFAAKDPKQRGRGEGATIGKLGGYSLEG